MRQFQGSLLTLLKAPTLCTRRWLVRDRIIFTTMGFTKGGLPFTHLGAPLNFGKPKAALFTSLVDKMEQDGWVER